MSGTKHTILTVRGRDENNQRISSKVFEEEVRGAAAVADELILESYGQHNIGLRLGSPDRPLTIRVKGPAGQRLGAMGLKGATIICEGSASDDVGYLNIGADVIVKGDATNGVCNAMAGGRVMIGGSIGARGLTMTKWNPDHERPEMWVLGSVGDTFAEFNCGGIGVVLTVGPSSSVPSQAWQAYLGRMWRMTCMVAGIKSSFSETSSPMRVSWQPQGQTLSASGMSWMTSTRGNSCGIGRRPVFLRAWAATVTSPLSMASGWPPATASASSKREY